MPETDKKITEVMAENRRLRNELNELTRYRHIDRKVEEELIRSQATTRAILEAAVDGIISIDTEGLILSCNPAASRIFGYPENELIGRNIKVLMPEPFRSNHDRYLQNYLRTGKKKIIGIGREVTGLHKDGTSFPMDLAVSEVNLPGFRFFTGTIRDITERKKAADDLARHRRELERSNAELQQFAYVASHDLQEPLRMVASYLQLLERRYRDRLDDDAREFIGFAVDGARRMQQLINDLLNFSRVGTRGGEFEECDIRLVIDGVLRTLRFALQDSDAKVETGPMPVVWADPVQMGQLFQNLISNALKFHGDQPPHIQISARQEADMWQFTVQDNGIGFDPEYQQRIFTIFQRLHSREEYPGTGIGLAICRKIVERHNGRIWAQSRSGQGSRFHFTLPVKGEST